MTPHDQMTKHDAESEAYWLADVTTANHPIPHCLDVLEHSPEWFLVENTKAGSGPFWLNVSSIHTMRIATGGNA